MNTLRLENEKDYIELRVTGYESENAPEDWLMLYGKICVNGRSVEGEDASVRIDEFAKLKLWAEEMSHNKKTSEWFPMEPNLEFNYSEENDELTVYFYPEHEFYNKGIKESRKSKKFYFTKKCEAFDWVKIIKCCDEVIANFLTRER